MEGFGKFLDNFVEYYVAAEDSDYVMEDTENGTDTADEITVDNETTEKERERLLRSLVRDKLFHKQNQALAAEYVSELQEIAPNLRGDKRIDLFNSTKGKHVRIAAGGHGVQNGE